MGIKDLWPQVKGAKQECSLMELREKRDVRVIAVDANIVISQYYRGSWSAFAKKGVFSTRDCYENTIQRLLTFCEEFAKANIRLVWCFDGTKTTEKLATAERQRDHAKRVFKLLDIWNDAKVRAERTPNDRNLLERYTNTMATHAKMAEAIVEQVGKDGIVHGEVDMTVSVAETLNHLADKLQWCPLFPPRMNYDVYELLTGQNQRCMRVPEISEAEKLASILNHIGYVQAVFGNDSDLIALKTPLIIRDFADVGQNWRKGQRVEKKVEIYAYVDVLRELAIPDERVLDFCVILGTDFNKRVYLHGPAMARKLVGDSLFKMEDFEAKHGKDTVQLDICRRFLSVNVADITMVSSVLV